MAGVRRRVGDWNAGNVEKTHRYKAKGRGPGKAASKNLTTTAWAGEIAILLGGASFFTPPFGRLAFPGWRVRTNTDEKLARGLQ